MTVFRWPRRSWLLFVLRSALIVLIALAAERWGTSFLMFMSVVLAIYAVNLVAAARAAHREDRQKLAREAREVEAREQDRAFIAAIDARAERINGKGTP
jgi:heme exporter protein D